jgi:transposase
VRGFDQQSDAVFVYLSPESFVPKEHPLRPIRTMVDKAHEALSPVFSQMYSHTGRPSIPPERLLKAMLLQVLYSIPSNVLLGEQIHYNILFRWFIGLGHDEPVWDDSSFSTNQERLNQTDIASRFLTEVLEQAKSKKLLFKDHFSVDGTLIQAWASIKSFKSKDDDPPPPADKNPTRDFRGEKLVNETHASTTDPEAKLYRKSSTHEARLSFAAHVLTENRHGLVVGSLVAEADGTAGTGSSQNDDCQGCSQETPQYGGRGQKLRHQGFRKRHERPEGYPLTLHGAPREGAAHPSTVALPGTAVTP